MEAGEHGRALLNLLGCFLSAVSSVRGQSPQEQCTLLDASMNLTPLYVMDRMMVGTFFMCSVDFCRNMGWAEGAVSARSGRGSPGGCSGHPLACCSGQCLPPTHTSLLILMLCVWLLCLRMSCACLVSVEANRGYRILLKPELWTAVTANVRAES